MSRVEGVKDMKSRIETLKKVQHSRVMKGLIAGAQLVRKDAQQNVPRRVGNLRSSAYTAFPGGLKFGGAPTFRGEEGGAMTSNHGDVATETIGETAKRTGGGVDTVAVGFTAPYALGVHENPRSGAAGNTPQSEQFKSPVVTRGPRKGKMRTAADFHSEKGGWKFLEKALNKSHEQVKRAIAAAAKLPSGPVRS